MKLLVIKRLLFLFKLIVICEDKTFLKESAAKKKTNCSAVESASLKVGGVVVEYFRLLAPFLWGGNIKDEITQRRKKCNNRLGKIKQKMKEK